MYQYRLLCEVCDIQVDYHSLMEALEFKDYHDEATSYSTNGTGTFRHRSTILEIEQDNRTPVIRRRSQ